MKLNITYTVNVTVDESKGPDVEKALNAAVKEFDASADVEETDCEEADDEDSKDES